MGLEDLDFSADTPKEEQGQGTSQSASSGEQGGYSVVEENGAKFYKLPESDYQALQKQSMKGTEYDKNIAEVSTLRDNLQQQLAYLEQQAKQPGQTKQEKQEKLSEIDQLRQEIQQLKAGVNENRSDVVSAKVDRELMGFKEAHKDIFTGNQKEDAELIDLICAVTVTACNATGNDNFPLEDAYNQFLKPWIEDAYRYRANQKKKQSSMDTEGNSTSKAIGQKVRPQNEDEADDEFAKTFDRIRQQGV
jgi:hypothetical protein